MSGITTALVVGGISAASSLASAKIQSNAAKGAAETQAAAADKALALQQQNAAQQRSDFSPYAQQGQNALGRLNSMANAPRQSFNAQQPQQLGQPQPLQMASLGNPQGMPAQGPQQPQGGPPLSLNAPAFNNPNRVLAPQSQNAGQDFGQMGQAVQQAPGGGPMPGALVKVQAPTGEIAHLPADMAQRAVAKGAKVIP